ncbi:hypothetical protein HPL003_25860 [Paenibacillus terrae HPL-003]|uniref:Uncharacterized protein n=1 Tax=Paenibacillus terrae (strain HPL-003) TaxID=985665 RepID=G7VQQ8_PAETH|nr:hypothetical protein HPL003_25860 [Paenibacillus terrae HPL-003]
MPAYGTYRACDLFIVCGQVPIRACTPKTALQQFMGITYFRVAILSVQSAYAEPVVNAEFYFSYDDSMRKFDYT